MRLQALSVFLGLLGPTAAAYGQVDITTWQTNLQHTGLNNQETTLTPTLLQSAGSFGILFSQRTAGRTYGQPLYLTRNTLNQLGGAFPDNAAHNAVYVATQAGNIYSFDADSNTGNNANPLWTRDLMNVNGVELAGLTGAETGSGDITGTQSLTTTPVIDPATGTIYVVVAGKNPNLKPGYQQYIWALDVKTGAPKFNSPQLITTTFQGNVQTPNANDQDPEPSPGPGQIPFTPLHEHLRCAMALSNGVVYLTYASHTDVSIFYGEILGYQASDVSKIVKKFIAAPVTAAGGNAAGIWMGGASPAFDADGNLFVITGNGPFSQKASPYTAATDWGESFIRMSTAGGNQLMTVDYGGGSAPDFFTPYYWSTLNTGGLIKGTDNQGDRDLGGGGILLLPDQAAGPHQKIMVGGGKQGTLYVLDQQVMGGLTTDDSTAIQEIQEPNGSGLYSTPAYFNGSIYYGPDGYNLEQRKVGYDPNTGNYIAPKPTSVSPINTPQKGSTPFISANNNTNGIVWTVGNQLYAFDANNVATVLWQSGRLNAPTNQSDACTTPKFGTPIVSGGKVYFSCYDDNTGDGFLVVAGEENANPNAPPQVASVTLTALTATSVRVAWTPSSGATSYVVGRAANPSGPFTTITTVSGATTAFVDNILNDNPGVPAPTPNTTYYYQVTAAISQAAHPSPTKSVTTLLQYAQPNLVAYWNLDETAGGQSQLQDSTGNGHTGTNVPEAGPGGPGYIGNSWVFHGKNGNDRVAIPNAADLQFTAAQSYTVTAWVNPTTLASLNEAVFAKSADQGGEYEILLNANNQWVYRAGPNSAPVDLVGPQASSGTWTQLAIVQDGAAGQRSLYVNGKLAAQGAAQDASGAGQLWLGQQNVASAINGYQGQLDEVRIYNAALTPAQVQAALAPPIVEAVSLQNHGTLGAFGVPLFPGVTPAVEPRIPSTAGAYSIQLEFAAPVTGVQASLGLQAGASGAAKGQVASVTSDSSGMFVTVALTGVADAQALNLHLTGIVPASNPSGAVPGIIDLPFDILQGDVSADHMVDGNDANAYKLYYSNVNGQGGQVRPQYPAFDVNLDGIVDNNDAAVVQAAAGHSFSAGTDALLSAYKTGTASTTNGGNAANNAFDNILGSQWESVQGASADPSSLYVDLGAQANIHTVVLNWQAAAKNFTIDATNTPNDPNSWKTLATVTGNTNPRFIETLGNLNGNARYVRMNGTARVGAYGYALYEFQVFGSFGSGGTVPTGSVPVVTGGTTTGTVGQAFSYQIQASGSPTSYTASPLPAGLSVNSGGLITGNPTAAGTTNVSVTATNGAGPSQPATLAVTINPAAPQPPAGFTAAAGNGQVALSWAASANATSYKLFRGLSSGGEGAAAYATVAGTSFTDTAVTNGTAYYYYVEAVNSTGASNPSGEQSATPTAPVTAPPAPPAAPANFQASASSSAVALSWTGSTGAAAYNVYRGTAAGAESQTPLAAGLTATTYTDAQVAAGTTYYYTVAAVSSAGAVSSPSGERSATVPAATAPNPPTAPSGSAVYRVDAGSATAVNPFAADGFVSGGGFGGTVNNTITNATQAPAAVYQSSRIGTFTYTFPGLVVGDSYTLNLHFAETYFPAAKQRVFSVLVNGKPVPQLTNFDIYAAAGGKNIANVQTVTATAVSGPNSGQITVAFVSGAGGVNNPQVNGLELLTNGGALPKPAQPVQLQAAEGSSQTSLSWAPGNGPAGTYNVYRGTAAGQELNSNPIATGIPGTYFVDTAATGLTNGTTYYYTVTANNASGASAPAAEVSTTPGAPIPGTLVYQINAGSTANSAGFAPYAADEFVTGGNASGTGNKINTGTVVSAAPASVYQSERSGGPFTYVLPNLNPGKNYLVRLHFAEFYFPGPGQRMFNVAINKVAVLQNFDIFAASGAQNTAIVEQFTTTADANGNITVSFTNGSVNAAKVSGLEVYALN